MPTIHLVPRISEQLSPYSTCKQVRGRQALASWVSNPGLRSRTRGSVSWGFWEHTRTHTHATHTHGSPRARSNAQQLTLKAVRHLFFSFSLFLTFTNVSTLQLFIYQHHVFSATQCASLLHRLKNIFIQVKIFKNIFEYFNIYSILLFIIIPVLVCLILYKSLSLTIVSLIVSSVSIMQFFQDF